MKPASRISNIKTYYFAQKLAEIKLLVANGKPIINLGIGSPDLEPHADVKTELKSAVDMQGSYRYQSYTGIESLRTAIADWYDRSYDVQLDPDTEVLPLMGSKEGINFISLAYLEKGDKVLVPDPGYPAYSAAANIAGAEVVYYDLTEENNWYPDFEQLERLVDENCKMMWLNYPNMPTTQAASLMIFEKLIAFARKHDLLLCNDNPYSMISEAKPISLLSLPDSKEVAIELNSLSKSHNMAGSRIGMLIGAERFLGNVFKVYSNFSSGMFLPTQKSAVIALETDPVWYDELNKKYKERRQIAHSILDLLGCSYNKNSEGLFVWGRIPKKYKDACQLSDMLLYNANVFVTPGNIFGSNGNSYIRISLCADKQQLKLSKNRINHLKNIDQNEKQVAEGRA